MRAAILFSAVIVSSMPCFGEGSPVDIEMELDAKWLEIVGYTATMTVSAKEEFGALTANIKADGVCNVRRLEDGRPQFKSEISGTAVAGSMGLLKTAVHLAAVSDGHAMYYERKFLTEHKVTKYPCSEKLEFGAGGGSYILEQARLKYVVTSLADSSVNLYRFQGVPKPGSKLAIDGLERVVWSIDKRTGILLKTTLLGEDNDVLLTVRFTNVLPTTRLADSDFAYTVPSTAKFKDKTG